MWNVGQSQRIYCIPLITFSIPLKKEVLKSEPPKNWKYQGFGQIYRLSRKYQYYRVQLQPCKCCVFCVVVCNADCTKKTKNLPMNPEKAAIAFPPLRIIRDGHLESVHSEIYMRIWLQTCEESHSHLHVHVHCQKYNGPKGWVLLPK